MLRRAVILAALLAVAAAVIAFASPGRTAAGRLDAQHNADLPYRVVLPDVTVNRPPPFTREQEYSLGLHDDARAAKGVAPLALDARLNTAAQGHAADMAAKNYFGHDSLDGRSPWDRLRDAGATFGYAGENIGKAWVGSGDSLPGIVALFDSMMAEVPPEDGHRDNILSPGFHKLGVGAAVKDGWLYWVCDFTD